LAEPSTSSRLPDFTLAVWLFFIVQKFSQRGPPAPWGVTRKAVGLTMTTGAVPRSRETRP
jgi:hypothetical protein